MSKRVLFRIFSYILLVAIASSCSKFRRIEKNPDWKVKYDAAMEYYNDKDYYRSSLLFEQILPIIRGLPEGEKVQFYMAYANYYQEYYILAAHNFKTFYETYGRSDLIEEARFMYAYSLYANSPSHNLDQTSSKEAVAAMQNFINRFPASEFRDDAAKVIDEIQKKLELKAYENAKQYYKLELYKASVVAFESFIKDYPDSEKVEEITYLKFVAQFTLAEKSIYSKQKERYQAANKYYLEFLDIYPYSEYLKDAEKKYGESLSKLNELAKNN